MIFDVAFYSGQEELYHSLWERIEQVYYEMVGLGAESKRISVIANGPIADLIFLLDPIERIWEGYTDFGLNCLRGFDRINCFVHTLQPINLLIITSSIGSARINLRNLNQYDSTTREDWLRRKMERTNLFRRGRVPYYEPGIEFGQRGFDSSEGF